MMAIEIVEDIDSHEWDEFLGNSSEATGFHTKEWIDAIVETYPNRRPLYIIARDSQKKIAGGMPVIDVSRFGIHNYVAMPFGTYGWPIIRDDASESVREDILAEIERFSRGWNVGLTRIVSLRKLVLPGFRATDAYTHILPLSQDAEAVWNSMGGKTRNQCRKANQSGVIVELENSSDAFCKYYNMYVESARRWGRRSPPYPWSLFANLQRRADMGRIKLWLAKINGEPVAGALCFYGTTEVIWWSGAMFAQYSKVCPNNALQRAIIEHACQRGYRSYNMGGSGDLEGVRRFKEGFGAKRLDYQVYERERTIYRAYAIAHKLLRKRSE